MIKIYNESNIETLKRLGQNSIDCVVTSPFYNTTAHISSNSKVNLINSKQISYPSCRYDVHVDSMTNDEYNDYCCSLMVGIDHVLKKNGVVCWNVSYGAENTDGYLRAVVSILDRTPFALRDTIVWKKGSALPNNSTPNALTRICEFVYVFVRKDEFDTAFCNKGISQQSKVTGQTYYNNVFNFIETKNNDEPCPLNKATFSTEFARSLLRLYCQRGGTVYDPFMGTGTTASAARDLGMNAIGSEISTAQCEWAKNRLDDMFDQVEIIKE